MKANEIQIGDWLYYKGQFNAFHFKVESITKKKVGYHAEPNEHRMNYLRLSECKPIPLTPEILKKNGFKHYVTEEDGDCFDNREGDLYYCLNRTADGYMSCIDVTHSFTISGLIKYVHELQHILRLCGLDKLVNNLKVEE